MVERLKTSLLTGEARVAVMALGTVLWGGAVWTWAVSGPLDRFGTLKGTDFAQFYIAARFAATGQLAGLYDWARFAADLKTVIPHSESLLYLSIYPPQLALLLAPLARFDYLSALSIWSAISLALYALAIALLVRDDTALSVDRRTVWLLAAAYPAFQQVMLHGQIGTLVLVLVAFAWLAWRRGMWWLAGFALGSLAFKPQMGAIAACALLLRPDWRLAAGMICGGLVQVAGVMVFGGLAPLVGYWHALGRVLAAPQMFEPKVWQMHSLRGAIDLVVGHGRLSLALWILAVGAVIVLAWRAARTTADRRLQFAAIVIAGLLINPHLYVYDLVVLAVPLCGIASWLLSRGMAAADRPLALGAFAVFWVPLLGPFAAVTHLQLTSLLLLYLLWQMREVSVVSGPSSHDR